MEHSCGRDVVRTASKADKKPPTTCSPGDAIDATPAKTNRRRLQYRIVRIFRISSSLYGVVEMIMSRSSKSSGNPCGDLYCVPLILAMPRFVAVINTGDRSLSSACAETTRSRNALKLEKETTHRHHSWKRVASMA